MNYYNEHDPKAAAWLRELIAQGHLPPGFVDSRDIQLVQPADLVGYTQCHFFAGIGGWSLALHLAGVPTTTRLWTGSCPCQPFSVAGKGLGKTDPRHLWPQFRRLIRLCRPPVVFGEQVASAAGRIWLSGVCADLEALAYRTAAADLCAAGGAEDCEIGILRGDSPLAWERATLSAPHLRQRLWWCAGRLALTGPQSARRQLRGSRKGPGETEQRSPDQFGGSGGVGGLADTHGGHPSAEREQRSGEHGLQPEMRGTHRLEYTAGLGWQQWRPWEPRPLDGRHEQDRGPSAESDHASAWATFDLIPCRDGKARRIESVAFWMADGLSEGMADVWRTCLEELEEKITAYAQTSQTSTSETLSELRKH